MRTARARAKSESCSIPKGKTVRIFLCNKEKKVLTILQLFHSLIREFCRISFNVQSFSRSTKSKRQRKQKDYNAGIGMTKRSAEHLFILFGNEVNLSGKKQASQVWRLLSLLASFRSEVRKVESFFPTG